MSQTSEDTIKLFSRLLGIAGVVLVVQALSNLLVAFVDGAITIDPLMLTAFLLPPVAQILAGLIVIFFATKRRVRLASWIALIGIIAISIVQSTGLIVIWAMYVPDAFDIQSVIAAYLPLTEFFLVGTSWYGGVGYAIGGIVWGLVFWATVALGITGLVKTPRSSFTAQ